MEVGFQNNPNGCKITVSGARIAINATDAMI
jgi:hypothetical protein